jgi:hypothetical protein
LLRGAEWADLREDDEVNVDYGKSWPEKRSQRLAIDGHKCQTCLHDGSEWRLEVHHKTYERLGSEEVVGDLITLCSQCHEAITSVIRSRRYAGRPVSIGVVSSTPQQRKDSHHGLEIASFSPDWRRPSLDAQRRTRKPFERSLKTDEADHV